MGLATYARLGCRLPFSHPLLSAPNARAQTVQGELDEPDQVYQTAMGPDLSRWKVCLQNRGPCLILFFMSGKYGSRLLGVSVAWFSQFCALLTGWELRLFLT